MAVVTPRFLPFVASDAPMSIVYRKLLDGGKGVQDDVLLTILHIIKANNLEFVREELAKVEGLDWPSRYNQLIVKFPTYSFRAGTFAFIEAIDQYVTQDDYATCSSDSGGILQIIFLNSLKLEPDLGVFTLLVEAGNIKAGSEKFINLNLFHDDAKPKIFQKWLDLLGYIFYMKYINKKPYDAVKASIVGN